MPRKPDAREKAKLRRGKGIGAMAKAGFAPSQQAEWCQKHDPFYKTKGMERHRKVKVYCGRG